MLAPCFLAAPGEVAGQRVFDFKLQDKEVLNNFDPVKEAGDSHKPVVKEFSGLRVTEDLKLELVPAKANCTKDEAPVIYFLESVLLSTLNPQLSTFPNPSPIQRTPYSQSRPLHHVRVNLRGRHVLVPE